MSNSGILLVDKPANMTSHDLVNIARKVFNTKKIGHNGTLDPDATGVMVLCIGQATRLNEYLSADDKHYRATLVFGNETDTQDSSGKVTLSCSLPELTENEFSDILRKFLGPQEQTPPVYSAIKKNGKPLYQYAREGEVVLDIPKRKIEIYSIQCLSFDNTKAIIDIHCSKGTYIRTLCQDIARACGSCGCMSELCRTAAGEFSLDQCIEINTLRQAKDPYSLLIPMSTVLPFPKIYIETDAARADLMNGKRLDLSRCNIDKLDRNGEWFQAVYQDNLLSVGKIEENCFIPKKVFCG
ncbi:MAG: tRNA pseudouridine(55) synthase TruB [Peptococcaceae bacterium]|nr:tRNA pseudouridine(55) synthase TruB [Peptococcaceae bacterium]